MRQVNSFRYWLAFVLLLCCGMTAQAQKNLTVGTSEHGTVAFKVGAATVTTASEGDKVDIVITPAAKGWKVDKVTATAYTSWDAAGARGEMPTSLPAVKVVEVNGTYSITMPAYNVQVDVTYKTTSLDGATIAAIPDQTYTGFQIKPTPEVKDGETVLAAGTDFTFEYGENINVATGGTVTVKPVEGSGFTGQKTVSFNIVPKSINADKISVDAIADQPYTGSQIKPAVVVKDGDRSVTLGAADYDLSYGENINVATGGTVTIKGKGNYKDERTVTFKITKVDPSVTKAPTGKTGLVYNANPQELVNGGNATGGKIEYSIDNGSTWSESIPTKTDANENGYPVQWRVTGDDNHNTTTPQTINVPIQKATLSELILNPESFTYDGKQKKPAETVKAGELTVPTTGYTIEGNTGTDAKEYTAKVTGKGNFKGTAQKKWTIGTADISNEDDFTASLNPTSFVYDGTEKKPTVTVTRKSDNAKLTLDTDFTVAYSNNINVGNNTAKATVTGKGNYKGTRVLTFSITNLAITSVTVDPASLTYNGKEQTITIKEVKAGTKVLTTADYDIVSGDKGTNVGEYTLTVQGKGNYAGQASTKWNITALSIANATVTLNPTEYTYDGTEKKPAATVKVTLDGTTYTLVKDKDFTVSYENNVQAGTATAKITGKGNYKDTVMKDFTIKKSDSTVAVDPTAWETTYGKGDQTKQLTLTPTDLTTVQWLSGNADVATVDDNGLVTATGAGVTTIYALVLGDNNYVSSWAVCEVTVKPQEIADVTVGAADASGIPVITAKNAAGETLVEGTDYEIEYTDLDENAKTADQMRQAPGKYLAVVTFIGNYQGIVKKEITVTEITVDTETLIDGLLNGTIPMGDVTDATKKYDVNNDGKVNVADVQAQMNIELGLNADGSQPGASRATAETAAEAVLGVSTEEMGGGVTRYTLSLGGGRGFSAFMMDVTASGAMQVVGQQAASDMTLRTGTLQDGTLRLLGLGSEQSGTVVSIDVMGEGSLSIGNICFSTKSASAFYARLAGDATSIDQLRSATAGGEYFGIGGQRQNELRKGVNIVRQNGKAVKVIRK